MRNLLFGVTAAALSLTAIPVAAGELNMVISDGRVSLTADNVPLRQILAEWARVGQTKVVGAERLAGTPMTLKLEGVPERQALETLLRSASGYMAAPRPLPSPDVSLYDRILILPTSNAPAAAPVTAARGGVDNPRGVGGIPPGHPDYDVPSDDAPPEVSDEEARDDYVAPGIFRQPEDQPAEANFDYANPQLMMQQRQQQMQGQQPVGTARPGAIVQPPTPAPNVFPGTAMPPGMVPPQGLPTSARPGEVVQPPAPQQFNPSGIPSNVQPGSVQGGAAQPDRAKYMNPYQPAQQQPTDQPD